MAQVVGIPDVGSTPTGSTNFFGVTLFVIFDFSFQKLADGHAPKGAKTKPSARKKVLPRPILYIFFRAQHIAPSGVLLSNHNRLRLLFLGRIFLLGDKVFYRGYSLVVLPEKFLRIIGIRFIGISAAILSIAVLFFVAEPLNSLLLDFFGATYREVDRLSALVLWAPIVLTIAWVIAKTLKLKFFHWYFLTLAALAWIPLLFWALIFISHRIQT